MNVVCASRACAPQWQQTQNEAGLWNAAIFASHAHHIRGSLHPCPAVIAHAVLLQSLRQPLTILIVRHLPYDTLLRSQALSQALLMTTTRMARLRLKHVTTSLPGLIVAEVEFGCGSCERVGRWRCFRYLVESLSNRFCILSKQIPW